MLSDGTIYGTLCALDPDTVEVSDEQMSLLRTLAKLIAHAVDEERHRRLLEERASSREVLLREISHDLRAPLTVVRSAAELMGHGSDDARVTMSSRMIVGASVRMTSMIEGLLDAEGHDAGVVEKTASIDLSEMLTEVAADTRAMLSGSDVIVVAEGTGSIIAGPQRLRRVLTNLTGNAARATRAGSIRLRCATEGDRVVVEVQDTGRGMDPESLATLGDAFSKGEGSTGFGLGLSIVQRLTAAMGGEVSFASVEGEGTTATLSLPATQPSAPGSA